MAYQDNQLQPDRGDMVTKLQFSPTDNHLLASCWDGSLALWNVLGSMPANYTFRHDSRKPVLDCAWSPVRFREDCAVLIV